MPLAGLVGSFTLPPLETAPARISGQPYTVILVVPTGVGAAIGGFAGDAMPVARAFASVADRVVTHPNVMNGAQLYWPDPKLLYTEGFALDEFAAGRWGLRPVTGQVYYTMQQVVTKCATCECGVRLWPQCVGLILDAAIEPELRIRHLQAADAVRATLGLNIGGYTVTKEPLGVSAVSYSSKYRQTDRALP